MLTLIGAEQTTSLLVVMIYENLEAGKGTVDDEVGAGGEGRSIACKIHSDGLQLFGLAQTVQGCQLVPLLDQGDQGGAVQGQVGADVAGADGVDADTAGCPFNSQGLG